MKPTRVQHTIPARNSGHSLPTPPLNPRRHTLPRLSTSHEHLIHLIAIVSLWPRRRSVPRRPHTAIIAQTIQLIKCGSNIEFSYSKRKSNFELDIRQVLPDAIARTLFKGPVGIGNDFVDIRAEEAVGLEVVGVRAPEFGVALDTG